MEQFYEEADEVADSEERYCAVNDDEEENFSEESLFHFHEMGSSSLDTDDVTGMNAQYHFRTTAYQKLDNSTSLPPFTGNKQDTEIKDVIKDNVLPFLPAKSLIRFRSVSIDWDRRINSPFLAHQQSYSFQELSGFFCQYEDTYPTFLTLNQAAYGVPTPSLRFLPDLVNIRSSSNGLLLCQGRTGNNSYYICNPANKNWKELPKPEYYHGFEPAIVLAFEPSVLNIEAHYQLICAVPLLDEPIVYFELYSSKTRKWTCSTTICIELGYSITFTGNGFYMKGTAYWETSTRKVLAFDVKNEIHGIIDLPSDSPPGGVLGEIHEELCYVSISNNSDNEYCLKIYGGIEVRLRHVINLHVEEVQTGIQGYRVLPYAHGDIVMILVGGLIYSYSLSDQKMEVISREVVDSLSTTLFLPYVNSLVCVA